MYPCGTIYSHKTNCANSSQMTEMFNQKNGNAFLIIMTVNALLEPGQADPVSYYIEDRNFLVFSETLSQTSMIEVSEYEMDTDNSLLPF